MLKALLIIALSALASLISVPVGSEGFRITFGIVVLISALHLFKPKHPVLLALVTGLAVSVVRIFADSMSMEMTGAIASNYLLEIAFYVTYAFVYNWAITTNTSKYPLPLVVALVLCDTGANTVEFALRHLAANSAWDTTSFISILLAAFVRSVVIVFVIWLFDHFMGRNKEGYNGISG